MTGSNPVSLYVHVPFCRSICHYCDFRRQIYRRETAQAWLDALEAELKETPRAESLETIYIGGGTPSALEDEELARLFSLLSPWAEHVKEYTMEINPETMRRPLGKLLRDYGINRISAGLQSASPRLLKRMNRRAGKEETEAMAKMLREYGIDNLSLDLMYSLPEETIEDLSESIDFAVSLSPAHLSLYSLTIEENSVFGKQGVKAQEEDIEADRYEYIVRRLQELGYKQYEISNFAHPGKESIHNVNVWNYHDFIGIGYGAHGKDWDQRYTHADSLRAYLSDPLYRKVTPLTREEQMFESLMMGMRLKCGMDRHLFQERFGKDVTEVYPRTIEKERKLGMIALSDDYLFCSDRGYFLLNSVLEEFLEEADL